MNRERMLLTTALSVEEAEVMFWLQQFLPAAGRSPLAAVKERGEDGITVDGQLLLDEAAEVPVIRPEPPPRSWWLGRIVWDSGTFWEPPSADYVEVGVYVGAQTAAEQAVLELVRGEIDQAAEYAHVVAAAEEWYGDGLRDESLMEDYLLYNTEGEPPGWSDPDANGDGLREHNRRVLRRAGL